MSDLTKASKFIALVLRHKPDVANITLDSEGWTPVKNLLIGMSVNGFEISLDDLETLVANDNKGRYSFSDDGTKIRANQGHSLYLQRLTFEECVPPNVLYHGTVATNLSDIMSSKSLLKMKRHHVHLSDDISTAKSVGARRGKPIVLVINSEAMHENGHVFYKSTNGVWLTDNVPSKYFTIGYD
jgi:putative RNA 2'-phosphotransferase